MNKLGGIHTGGGVHGQAVDIHAGIGQNFGPAVNGAALAVKHAAQHILAYAQLHAVA